MKISELYSQNKQTFSFEFFPPKTEDSEKTLFETIAELEALNPSFVSVTYGAMGTTRENTLRIVSRIKGEIGVEPAAHLTCVGHTVQEIDSVLEQLKNAGIQNIVALRGDPPKGEEKFVATHGGFHYASELVDHIKNSSQFSEHFAVAVAGYPEGHVEASDRGVDLQNLKTKVSKGSDVIMTQLFFDNSYFFRFRDDCRKLNINVPIVAGIMPVTNGKQIQRFSDMCGASIPGELHDAIERYGDDLKSIEAFGVEYASRQCEELLVEGVEGLHFYTLNKSKATKEIYMNLNLHETKEG